MLDDSDKIEFVNDVLSALPIERTLAFGLADSILLESLHDVCLRANVSSSTATAIRKELLRDLYFRVNSTTLENLRKTAARCNMCPEMAHDDISPNWNKTDPDVLFVSENVASLNSQGADLFKRSLIRTGFKSDHVGLTYLTRCSKKTTDTIRAEEIKNCSPYLFSEIQLMNPKLVVTFGAPVAHVLLGDNIKLGDDPSEGIYWLGPWAVMALWSPNYAAHPKQKLQERFQELISTAYDFVYK